MGMTYFKRYRMEFDLSGWYEDNLDVPPNYQLLPFSSELLREHANAKFNSFRKELDANVFPCLARRDGCLRLMRDISGRQDFVAGATWLIRYQGGDQPLAVGTIQGLAIDGWGAIQNLGIDPDHRGRGLGSVHVSKAAGGFRAAGLSRMHLEVTTENTGAVRLYERLGFKKANVVYKAAEVAGADR